MRSGRSYVEFSQETLQRVREIDLLTYLRACEPDNLKRISASTYATRDHDSLKISNGKWFWWSRGIGGGTALDYLIKVREMHFVQAVELLADLSGARELPHKTAEKPKESKPKALYLPPKNDTAYHVMQYLTERGIDKAIIQSCLDDGTLYESRDWHHAVFVGRDEHGTPKFAAIRSTMGKPIKRDASGSDKRFSFRLSAQQSSNELHLFEAAIDLLSYATYLQHIKRDFHRMHLLSLAGVYQPAKDMKSSKIPAALTVFLEENPQIQTIYLHLDNDKAGRMSSQALMQLLQNKYEIVDAPPPIGKDINDFLLHFLQNQPHKAQRKEQSYDK